MTPKTRKPSFKSIILNPEYSGKEIEKSNFQKHQKTYANYKLKVLRDFFVVDPDGIIYSELMKAKSFIEMDRITRGYIERRLHVSFEN